MDTLMAGEHARLCFTSPPYNMASGDMYKEFKDNQESNEYINFNITVAGNVKRYLRGFLFWNISYNKKSRWEFIEIFYRLIKDCGYAFLENIVWDKGSALPISSPKILTRQYENILAVSTEEIEVVNRPWMENRQITYTREGLVVHPRRISGDANTGRRFMSRQDVASMT